MAEASIRSSTRMPEGSFIESDRPCAGCGYNLKGLLTGNNCPECGRIIATRFSRSTGHLGNAPVSYLSLLGVSFLVAGVALFFLIPILGVIQLTIARAQLPHAAGFMVVSIGVALAWCAGLAILVLPRKTGSTSPKDSTDMWTDMRLATGMTQLLWIAVPALTYAGGATSVAACYYAAIGAWYIAAAGLVPTAILIARFAHWASDSILANRALACAWCLGCFGAASLIIKGLYAFNLGIGFLSAPFLLFFVGVWYLAAIALSLLTMQMASNARWAIINARQQSARDLRLTEKAQHEREQAAHEHQPAGPLPVDAHLLRRVEDRHSQMSVEEVSDASVIGTHHQKTIRPATGSEGYTLEDAPDPPTDPPGTPPSMA